MVRVAVLVNRLVSTSIPVEIAAKVHHTTDTDLRLISYYDSPDDRVDPDIEELSVPKVKLGAKRRTDHNAYLNLRKICYRDNIEVLHTHHNSTGSLGRLAMAGTKTAVVNTEHNDHHSFTNLQKLINSISYPIIDVNVSNSSNTQESFEWFEQILLSRVQNEIVYNGIDAERIDDAHDCTLELPDGPKIVIVGSLTQQKNHKTLFRAFNLISDDIPDSSLIVVGKGPLSENLKRMAKELDIDESVFFTGYLPRREDVYAVMNCCDLGVFPSWYEGFCVAVVEAMAVGLPVVVSDLDVLREVVGGPGVFADPNDPEEFADAITDLLQNPQKRKVLGNKGKKRARSRFSLERTAREYYNIYKQVAKTPKR